MKKLDWFLVGIIVLILTIVYVFNGSAGSNVPQGVQVFGLPEYGLVCVLWPDGSGDCYCPCEGCDESIPPTDVPSIRPTPTNPPPQEATPTPASTPTNVPEPTEKPKCNRGLGNGAENCDPGNSYGQGHGQGRGAGEDRSE